MSSIQLPEDIKVLKYLETEPHTRYDVATLLKAHYADAAARLDRLRHLDYIFIQRDEDWHGRKRKYYLITVKGRAILRGFEEAERR